MKQLETSLLSIIDVSMLNILRYKNHLKLIGGAIGLLVATLGISVWFALISLDKSCIRTKLDMISPIGIELKRTIETRLKYGLSINDIDDIELKIKNFEQILNYSLNNSKENLKNQSKSTVFVLNAKHEILYGRPQSFQKIDFDTDVKSDTEETIIINKSIQVINSASYYNLLIPINNSEKQIISYVVIQIGIEYINDLFKYSNTIPILIVSVLSIISSLTLVLSITKLLKKNPVITTSIKRRISTTIFAVVCSSQIIFFTFSISQLYFNSYRTSHLKSKIILSLLTDRFEHYLHNDIDLFMIADMDSQFDYICTRYPEISSISLVQMDKKKYSSISPEQTDKIIYNKSFYKTDHVLGDYYKAFRIFVMLFDRNNKCYGSLLGKINPSFLFKKIQEFTLDLLTVIVVTILLMVELLILLFMTIETNIKVANNKIKIHYSYMRPAAFLFLFGIDISMSFLPLHAENIYNTFWGLSKDTVMGLPISVEFFFVGIAIFICGFWNDRRGWHEPFLSGLFLAATGGIYSWIAPDILHFIISRALVGTGYGFLLLSAQGFIVEYTDVTNRAQGLAQFIAGLYAGSICGGATGALLAQQFGYRSVFLFGAIILYCVIVYVFVFLRHAMIKPSFRYANKERNTITQPKWKPFLQNKIVLALILFSSLPASIAVVGFLNYFSPIYLDSIGASQATIGRVLMIYGVSLIYLGPMISRHVDASFDKKRYIFFGCLLGGITFLMFNFTSGIYAAILAVFLLGLSSSFVIASQGAYLLSLNVTQQLGPGKALAVFRATSRLGQALGPLLFSLLTISANVTNNITQLGLFYLLTAFLFLLITYKDNFEFKRSLL